jgi:hypothetical protein
MSLFVNTILAFEKIAYSKLLEKDPTTWPVGIIKEAYKQLPYLKGYEVDVTIDRSDEARGYGVGKLLVYPARMAKKAAAQDEKLLTIPIIIRDREMSPLDVLSYKNQMVPESETKVAEILHTPDTFSKVEPKNRRGSASMISAISPPTASGQQSRYSGYLGKSASVTQAAIGTFAYADVERFLEKVSSDPAVRVLYETTPVLREYVEQFDGWIEKTAEARWQDFLGDLSPTVVQFQQEGLDYVVKVANHKCFAPVTVRATRFEVKEQLSKTAMSRLLTDSYLTLSTSPVMRTAPVVKTASVATRPGIYKVKIAGRDVEGVVIPKMIDFDGRILDSQMFIGPSQHSMQDAIAGAFLKEASLEGAYPRGKGVFIHQKDGLAVATEPVEITNISTTHLNKEKLASLHGRLLSTGRPVTFSLVPGLQKIANIANQVIAIPDSFEFLPIKGLHVQVSSDPASFDRIEQSKTASASNMSIVSDGDSYSLRGEYASIVGPGVLNRPEAEFALGSLGLTGEQARGLMKRADHHLHAVSFRARAVVPEANAKLAFARRSATITPTDIAPLRVDLIKEATVIVDKETVDSILSLQFMTPDNVGTYVDYIPEISKTLNKVAEVLVAARLGMDDVKESAAKNAMSQLGAVLNGLTNLRDKVRD